MTPIAPASSVGSATAATSGSTAAVAAAASGNSIANSFMTLLVAQLQNQDPLNPMDNSEMTSQLAQISTVTGINQLNSTVSALSASMGSNQYVQAAGLVGHNVLVPGNTLALTGATAAGGFNLAAGADDVVVTISDSSGHTVRQIDLGAQGAGPQTFTWNAKTNAGATAAAGQYTFAVQATQGGNAVAATTLMSGQVNGIVLGSDGTTQLQLGSLGQASLATVVEIN